MRCREGDTLSEISRIVRHSEEQVLLMLEQATGIVPQDIEIILRMKQEGNTLQELSLGLEIDIEILKKFLADDQTDSTSSRSSAGLLTTSEKVRRITSIRGSGKQLGAEDLRLTAPARLITDILPHEASPIGSPCQVMQDIKPSIPVQPPQIAFTPPLQVTSAPTPNVATAQSPKIALAPPLKIASVTKPHVAYAERPKVALAPPLQVACVQPSQQVACAQPPQVASVPTYHLAFTQPPKDGLVPPPKEELLPLPQIASAQPPQVAPAPPLKVALAPKPDVALAAPLHISRDLPMFIPRPFPRQENREAVLQTSETDEGMYPVSSSIYSYSYSDNLLYITNLDTQLTSSVHIQGECLYYGTCWTELPDGSLLTTGGAYGKVFSIEVPSFAVTRRASMHFNRTTHASVYHDRYVYAVGGNSSDKEPTVYLRECERYLTSEDRWEDIPPIPEFCGFVTCLVLESNQSLYALGTPTGEHQGIIQNLCLTRLNWTVLALKLPHEGGAIPVFKLSEGATKMYFVQESCLYSFNPFFKTIQLVKTLSTKMSHSFFGPSYYRGGMLYCSNCTAAPFKFEIGQLS
jgi:hypothetical protein